MRTIGWKQGWAVQPVSYSRYQGSIETPDGCTEHTAIRKSLEADDENQVRCFAESISLPATLCFCNQTLITGAPTPSA